ncbi:MAG: hypothetical protein PVJ72_17500, partial [Gammaproteobacteria bacterium]
SIEARGLDHPPNISRRYPDDTHYIIIDGGNTRLEILNILYDKYSNLAKEANEESQRLKYLHMAERFYRIDCVFRPWISESDTLAGHMSENEERGDILFIEKAIAVQRFRKFYQAEDKVAAEASGTEYTDKPLTIRALAERITNQGWTISHTHISRFEYAANRLINVVPNALWAGAGEPLVRNLRRHEKAYLDFWVATGRDSINDLDLLKLFYETLAKYDGDSVDLDGFVSEMNSTLGQKLGLPSLTVCAEIDAYLAGRTPPTPLSFQTTATVGSKPTEIESGSFSGSDDNRPPKATIRNLNSASTTSDEAQNTASTSQPNTGNANEPCASNDISNNNSDVATSAPESARQIPTAYPESIAETERAILAIARAIAVPYEFTVYGLESGPKRDEVGCGSFLIAPVKQSFNPQSDDTQAAVWWALFRLSRAYRNTAQVSADQVFRKAYSQYLAQRSTLDTLLMLDEIFAALSDDTYKQFEELQRLIRRNNKKR